MAKPKCHFVRLSRPGAPRLSKKLLVCILAFATSGLALADSPFSLRYLTKTGDVAPGTTNIFGSFYPVSINAARRVAFSAGLTTPFANDEGDGIWRTDTNKLLNLVVKDGQSAPGTVGGVTLSRVQMTGFNNSGEVSFVSTLAGGALDQARGLFAEVAGAIQPVAVESNAPPGYPAWQYFGLSDCAFNDRGQAAFFALVGPTYDSGNVSVWIASPSNSSFVLRPAVIAGWSAPGAGFDATFYGLHTDPARPAFNNQGQVAFAAELSGASIGPTNSEGLWIGTPDGLTMVAQTGQPAPGFADGVYFGNFSDPGLNNAGEIVFEANLAAGPTPAALFATDQHGQIRAVARLLDQAPGTSDGVVFIQFYDRVISDGGRVCFLAQVAGGNVNPGMDDLGLWTEGADGLVLVAREGGALPGNLGGKEQIFNEIAQNDSGQTIFMALAMGTNGLFYTDVWETDVFGRLFQAADPGASVQISPGDIRIIQSLRLAGRNSGGQDGRHGVCNALGDLAGIVSFSDGSQAVAVASADSDGDGLWDIWERDGIDWNGDGIVDLDLPALGADPNHKDLFVEVEAMVARAPSAEVLSNVTAAFAAVPNALAQNPDGKPGITLHVLLNHTNIPQADWINAIDTTGDGYNNWVTEFDTNKDLYFGTDAERASANWPAIRKARERVYRCCIFANTFNLGDGAGYSGLAELPGNDCMVTFGDPTWSTDGADSRVQAGTFMHELGHTLGLRHGGGDNTNNKPNYISVMNYAWQFPTYFNSSSWRLDYSREQLPELDEEKLDEADGLPATTNALSPRTFYGDGYSPPHILSAPTDGSPIDWNDNGYFNAFPVFADINRLTSMDPYSPGQHLIGQEDWSALQFRIAGNTSYDRGAHGETSAQTEMTGAYAALLNAPPSELCALFVNNVGGNIVISWNCAAVLSTSQAITGPWTRLTNAASPYTNSSAAAARFFRLEQ